MSQSPQVKRQVSFQAEQQPIIQKAGTRGVSRDVSAHEFESKKLLNEIKSLQDALVAKEEESSVTIVNLKEENSRLQRLLKQEKTNGKAANNDRELAKLSVENELLKKQIEELKAGNRSSISSNSQ